MHIVVSTDHVIQQFADRLAGITDGKLRRAEIESLNEAGDLERTPVRQALRHQMNVRRYGSIVSHTRTGRATAGGLRYTIYGVGPGLPITDFPVTGGVGGKLGSWRDQPRDGHGRFGALPNGGHEAGRVVAQSWGVAHRFKRSYVSESKGYVARLPGSRAERKLFGPSVAKEIIKGETAAGFQARAARTLEVMLFKRIGRLLP